MLKARESMRRRTPEEKQAKREQRTAEQRAKFEQRVAQTAAADAAAKAEAQRQHDAFVSSVAKKMADGAPMKFLTLGVTIHDGGVYKDDRLIGLLVGSTAKSTKLPPVWRRSVALTLILIPDKQQVPRIMVEVKTGEIIHSKVIEGRLNISTANREVKNFNAAAEAASAK
jgi:hypothetical protein